VCSWWEERWVKREVTSTAGTTVYTADYRVDECGVVLVLDDIGACLESRAWSWREVKPALPI
jgi:hypothetical protein